MVNTRSETLVWQKCVGPRSLSLPVDRFRDLVCQPPSENLPWVWNYTHLRGSRPVPSCEKWKSQLLTLSDQFLLTDRPVSESESNFVQPKFWKRSVGHKIFTLLVTPTRPFSHERTGREPRRYVVSSNPSQVFLSFTRTADFFCESKGTPCSPGERASPSGRKRICRLCNPLRRYPVLYGQTV